MSKARGAGIVALACAVAVVAAGCGKSASSASSTASTLPVSTVATTPAGTGTVPKITWALYRDVGTLDPVYAFDYPENTADSLLCDSLLRQNPDGTTSPGLATSIDTSNPLKWVVNVRPNVTFWDGHPLTAADVVYSLKRNTDPKVAGYYPQVFSRVSSITATGPLTVAIDLTKPDFWLEGELSSIPGMVVEKAYVEAKGKSFGTPQGGVMCTGPYKLKSWQTGAPLQTVANPAYWDSTLKPKVQEIDLKGIPDEATATSAFLSGDVTGGYPLPYSGAAQLKTASNGKLFEGPSYATIALILSNPDPASTLGDIRVRKALELAIDYNGLINTAYAGEAFPLRTLANPGTWGYGRDVFQRAWDASPEATTDLVKAKALIAAAGAQGKSIVLGSSSELATVTADAVAVQSAAQSIGLKATIKSVSAANYINFFIDPSARKGVDGFFTTNYPDYADPAGLYSTLAVPGGSQNYNNYSNPAVTAALEAARSAADPTKRAQFVVAAQRIIDDQLPWIPIAGEKNLLFMNNSITGAPTSFSYMFAPWGAMIGSAG